MTNNASVSEFNNQRNKLPGDRKRISAVGKYVLELYEDPIGQSPRTVIEINKKYDDGGYGKISSVWFNTIEDEDGDESEEIEEFAKELDDRQFEDPEAAAREAFEEMANSVSEIESYL